MIQQGVWVPPPPERTLVRRIVGVLGAGLGTVGVFGLLLAMNAMDRSPPKPPEARVTQLAVAPQQKPKAKPRPKPQPRKTPPRKAPPKVPTLAAGVGGLDLGLGGGGLDLGDATSALLGDASPSLMTADAVDTLPVPTKQVGAAYPAKARSRGITGEVVLELDIDERGRLTDARVLSARPTGVFEDAALQTVRQWAFAPATYQGRAVAVSGVALPITFDLER
ncbi:MAG: energy transducer TonB [Alphaproteobacteria bacterium]|nr:energy transducer TonB [Alphaproteobacteria bacterium]